LGSKLIPLQDECHPPWDSLPELKEDQNMMFTCFRLMNFRKVFLIFSNTYSGKRTVSPSMDTLQPPGRGLSGKSCSGSAMQALPARPSFVFFFFIFIIVPAAF
jgi:hypothetical protein